MYSAIPKGKAAAWFRSVPKRSWFAGVLILALCVPAISACSAGGNGEGEAGGTATGKGSSAPVEFEYGNEVEHWNVALSDRSRDSFDEAAYNAALQEFRAAIEGDDASALLGAYDELERLFADLSSDRVLANFDQACAGFDEAAASAYAAKQAAYDSHYQECAHAFMDALESKHGEAFRAHIGEGLSSVLGNSSATSSESAALRAKRDDLAGQYSALVAQDASDAELKRLYVELVNANNAWARSLGYENYVEYVLFDKLVAVREGFAINEAEMRIYREPDLTVDKVDAIWAEVYEKYSWPADENEWLSTSHLFTSPFYYAAYGTSALASLDLFAESRSDYAAAVGTYLRLSELAPETTYCQALEAVGLPNYLEKGQVTAFSIRLANALGV